MSVAEDYLNLSLKAPHVVVPFITKPSSTMTPAPNRPGEAAARWVPWAERQIMPLADFRENWDGYNGAAPNEESMWNAIVFLACLKNAYCGIPEPHINPTRDGGISLEWETHDKYLEIEFDSTSTFEYLFKNLTDKFRRAGKVSVGSMPAKDFFSDLNSIFAV